jgi:hypothetical protein
MTNAAVATIILMTMALSASAGEWSLRLGDIELEGISVDESTGSASYHLSLANDTVWFTFTFPIQGDSRPERALAERVSLNGFGPDILCDEMGPEGVLLEGDRIAGDVICSSPPGTVRIEGRFDN